MAKTSVKVGDEYPEIKRGTVDGIYDDEARDSVKRFQKIKSLEETGIVDYLTFMALADEYRHIEYAVEKYGDMLFRICFSILLNEADAEDALQETFIRYMTKAPLFSDSDHEKAWLIKVATNLCKNMCVKR